jgi:hypothetical protein
LAVVVELGIHFYGHQNFDGIGGYAAGAFDNGFQSTWERLAAARKEARGAGVTVNGGAVGYAEVAGKFSGALPKEERVIDGSAVWVAANIALNAMVGGAGVFAAVASATPEVGHG